MLNDPRLQDPNTERSPQEIRRNNGLSKRLKGGNQESTVGILGSR